MRLWRMKEMEWWVWWKPWRVKELKSDKAFSGGLFTIFWMRRRASFVVGDIFGLVFGLSLFSAKCAVFVYVLVNGPGRARQIIQIRGDGT